MSPLFRLRQWPALRAGLVALSVAAACGPGVAQTASPGGDKQDKQIANLIAQQKWSEVLPLVEAQLKDRPDDTLLLMHRGAALSNLNRKAEALSTFQKVATLNPRLAAAHNNIAVILASDGKYEEARAKLDLAIRTHPAYATAYENLGDLYSHMAGDAYRKALQLEKNLKSAQPKLRMVDEITAMAGGAAPAAPTRRPASPTPPEPPPPAAASTQVAQAPATPPKTVLPKAEVEPAQTVATAVAGAAPAPARAESTDEVENALKAWAQAWSRRDMVAYAKAYTADFKGSSASHAAWLADRRARIEPRKSIEVELSKIDVRVNGDRAEVRFLQHYESDGLKVRSRKSVSLQKSQGRWLIREESGR